MTDEDRQYDELARALDAGDTGKLSDEQRRLADEIRQLEGRLGGMMDADLPPGVRDRVANRMRAELARPGRTSARRRSPWLQVAGVAAAMVAVGLITLLSPRTRPEPDPPPVAYVVTAEEVANVLDDGRFEAQLDLLAMDVEQLEAEQIVSAAMSSDSVEWEIDETEQEIDRFWSDDPFEGLYDQ
jgi:hypothetical protein